jgi:alginate O-acetyltransferase complex protein AlgI
MLFPSYEFIFMFLPITLGGFFLAARAGHQWASAWLAVASLFFYGCWNPRFVLLLLASIAFNYAMGAAIGKAGGAPHGRRLLAAAIAANLLLLGIFKYANFFISTANRLTGAEIPILSIVLPLGISFFTFTQIAFLVDVHRGLAREYNPIHYALFVSYFPHLVAGPILHHQQMMPQFEGPAIYRINAENIAVGLTMFTIGLAKKVLLADNFGEYASPVFDAARDGQDVSLMVAWAGALAYSLQLYFDFSGYSDMAVGLSRLFGIHIPLNFDSPYKARNIIEFWRRWHMTLSKFLRDYLYIPLGGNRQGKVRRYVNLLITMLLGGLWHGAGWTFVAWGALHGAYLIVNHGWQALCRRSMPTHGGSSRVGGILGTAVTFLAVVVAWVFFRSENFTAAIRILHGMAGLNGVSLPYSLTSVLAPLMQAIGIGDIAFDGAFSGAQLLELRGAWRYAVLLATGLFIVWGLPNTQQLLGAYRPGGESGAGRPPLLRLDFKVAVAGGSLFALSILSMSRVSDFLYYQF